MINVYGYQTTNGKSHILGLKRTRLGAHKLAHDFGVNDKFVEVTKI